MKKLSILFVVSFLFPQLCWGYFYPSSYLESRESFLSHVEQLKAIAPDIRLYSMKVPTKTKATLFIDAFFMPPADTKLDSLVILSGGIHGVEAFTGSAIQHSYIQKLIKSGQRPRHGLLVVHAVNPFGFHFKRRVDEDNVDLNRNIGGQPELFEKYSSGYNELSGYLNPHKPLNTGLWSEIRFFVSSIYNLATIGMKKMRQAAIGGQYQNPKGIYYGGAKVQANGQILRQLFSSIGASFNKIVHLDLHTGYGKRGQLHFFSSKKMAQLPGFDQIFSDYDIDLGDDKDFYDISGGFDQMTIDVFKNKAFVVPMVLEFGTMNSQTILGSFASIRNLVFENQGHHYGYKNKDSEQEIKNDFLEMFNPSDKTWRDKVVNRGTEVILEISAKLNQIN